MPGESTETDETTYGTLAASVTDQPSDIADFESLVVTLQGVWVKPAGGDGEGTDEAETDETADDEAETDEAETDEAETDDGTEASDAESPETESTETGDDSGRRYIEFDEPQTADLVELQGANTQSLGEWEIATGAYQFLQFDVSGVEGTLTDGSEATVETPGNAPLKFNESFEIRANERTHFVADFTPVERGNGSYLIRPVASGTTVLYGDAEYTAEDASETESGATDAQPTATDGQTPSGTATDSGTATPSGTATDGSPGNSGSASGG